MNHPAVAPRGVAPEREELRALLREYGVDLGAADDDTSLIDSGTLDSLAQYRFMYAGDDEFDRYLVLRCAALHDPALVACIADLEAIDQCTRTALLSAATAPAVLDEIRAWTATLRRDDLQFLDLAGFLPAPATRPPLAAGCILVRATGEVAREPPWKIDEVDLLESGNWDMRMRYAMAG